MFKTTQMQMCVSRLMMPAVYSGQRDYIDSVPVYRPNLQSDVTVYHVLHQMFQFLTTYLLSCQKVLDNFTHARQL